MKKFMTLLLAAGMVVSAANGASAVDLKLSGTWDNTFQFADNMYGEGALGADNVEEAHFAAFTRLRLNMDFIVDETLSGRMQIQAGKHAYGAGANAAGEDGDTLTARHLYVDWLVPGTDVQVRMGRQDMAMPSYTFGSPFFDEVVDGVAVSAPINDMVAVNLGWARPAGVGRGYDKAYTSHSDFDIAYLSVDVAADGFAVSPWFMVGRAGSNSGAELFALDEKDSSTMGYLAGIGAELTMFDPFKFTADFVYTANDADGDQEQKGWYAAAGVELATSFATPFLRGWYATGVDEKDNDAVFGAIGGGFDASSIYFDANGFIGATIDNCTAQGTWGAQLGVKDLSFIEGLTHELTVTYFEGTNDKHNADAAKMLTEKDSIVELSALTSYQLYKNLSANLLLAYMITDLDKGVHGATVDDQNGFRGALNFQYKF